MSIPQHPDQLTPDQCNPVLQGSSQDLTERTVSSEVLVNGGFLNVSRDSIELPDGRAASRLVVRHPGAVAIIALAADGRAILERQYRYAPAKLMVEFPAGKLEAHESILTCARRELLEETGYSARQWAYAGQFHMAAAYCDEVVHIYFAKDLQAGPQQLDDGEFVEVFSASLADLQVAIAQGAVTNATTLTCALWWQNVVSGLWPLNWHDAPVMRHDQAIEAVS